MGAVVGIIATTVYEMLGIIYWILRERRSYYGMELRPRCLSIGLGVNDPPF